MIDANKNLEAIGEEFRLCGVVSSVEKRITKKDNRRWASFHLVASRVLLQSMEIYWWRAIVAAMRMHRTTEGDERFTIQEIVTTPQFLSQHTGLAFWHISSKSNLL